MDATSLLARVAGSDVYRLILESLEDGVYLVDSDRRIVYWNEGAERITGYLRQDVIGRHCADNILLHCSTAGVVFCEHGCPLATTMHDGRSRRLDAFLKHREGHRVPVSIRSAPVRDADGAVLGAVEIFHVDTRHFGLLQVFNGLEPYACLDEETGLPNRPFFEARLRHHLDDLRAFGIPVGVFSVRIGDAARIEARGGHAAYAALLRAAAQTIAETMEPRGFVGRWAHDRFVGLLGNVDTAALRSVADRVASLVQATRVEWWGDAIPVSVNVATTMAEASDTPDGLVARLASPSAHQAVG
jgi:PAS domain S-box-containing protein/diguanylate cyclase (GGDEF)-like protein